MPQIIEVPGMGQVEFPDDMGDEQITAAIRANSMAPPQAPPAKTGMAASEDFLRAEMQNADPFTRNLAGAGTALSNLWEGAKQLVGKGDAERITANRVMAEEAPVGAVAGNLALTAIPFAAAGNTIKAASAVGGGLGLLKPVEGEQSLGNIASGKAKAVVTDAALAGVGQKVANVAGGWMGRKAAEFAALKAKNAPQTQLVNEALDAGLVIPPSSVNPSFANTLKEGVAGKAATAQGASNKNAPALESLARRSIGVPDDAPLTPEVTKAVRDQAYVNGYKPIADLPAINWDFSFKRGVKALSPKSKGGAVKDASEDAVEDLIGRLSSKGSWTGEQLIHDIRLLREQAQANFRGGAAEQGLARAQKDAAKLLEGLAERNIILNGGSPQAVQAMKDARKLIAKAHTVEEAMAGGVFDPKAFGKRFKAGKPMEGEQKLIGQFVNAFPKAAQPTAKIAGPGVSKLNSAMGLLSGGGGFAVGGPIGAAVMGAAPFVVPPAVRAQLLSKGSQNALRDLYRLGLPERVANRLLQNAPVGLTVFGSDALLQ